MEFEMTAIEMINDWKENNIDMYNLFIQDCFKFCNEMFDYDYTLDEFIKSDDFDEDFHNWYAQV